MESTKTNLLRTPLGGVQKQRASASKKQRRLATVLHHAASVLFLPLVTVLSSALQQPSAFNDIAENMDTSSPTPADRNRIHSCRSWPVFFWRAVIHRPSSDVTESKENATVSDGPLQCSMKDRPRPTGNRLILIVTKGTLDGAERPNIHDKHRSALTTDVERQNSTHEKHHSRSSVPVGQGSAVNSSHADEVLDNSEVPLPYSKPDSPKKGKKTVRVPSLREAVKACTADETLDNSFFNRAAELLSRKRNNADEVVDDSKVPLRYYKWCSPREEKIVWLPPQRKAVNESTENEVLEESSLDRPASRLSRQQVSKKNDALVTEDENEDDDNVGENDHGESGITDEVDAQDSRDDEDLVDNEVVKESDDGADRDGFTHSAQDTEVYEAVPHARQNRLAS